MSNAANDMQTNERRIGPDEELITLTEAAKHLPKVDGKKVAICTLWRWCRLGLRGVFLEYVRVGRRICTTREALLRFFSELADLDLQCPPSGGPKCIPKRKPITSRQRLRSLKEADDVLARAGI